MEGVAVGNCKPHVVCVPFPLQGHIGPMLKLAKLLHHKGFHVTFVNTEHNHKRILDSRGPNALDAFPDFCFETLPINHVTSHSHTSLALSLLSIREACRREFMAPFRTLLAILNDTQTSRVPPVTCILTDFIMNYSVAAAEELGIPSVFLCTMSIGGFLHFKQSRDLMKKGLAALNADGDSNANADANANDASNDKCLDTSVNWIPGMKGARLRDVSNFLQNKDTKEFMNDSSKRDLERTSKASAVIFHTFDSLEGEQLNNLSSMFERIYNIGPLQLLLNNIPENHCYKSIDCNLWSEDSECIEWLKSKEPNSVVYVNFGSTITMSNEQLIEFAWGIASSNINFLWIIRPDLVIGDTAILPEEFVVETKERGLLASWCQQDLVLSHPSVGGFITHCGWNSTIESISDGVPMICSPCFGDQYTNSKYICNEWGVGMELSDNFKRDDLEKLVRDLMEGENGKEIKKKVLEWKTKAEEAATPAGSSSINLDNLVNEVLLSKH